MIGSDAYSRQVFIYLDPILIYISLWIDCLFEIRKIAVFPLAFIAGWLQGHWWGFISRNYAVWPTFLLMNVFVALKGSHFWFLFESTAYPKFAKLRMFPLAFVSGCLQGHWWGFISRNYVVWPIFVLMNVFIALKGTLFWFLFAFIALKGSHFWWHGFKVQ